MKYKILKDFKGSQDGTVTEYFTVGTEVHLSDYLVSAVDPKWIEAISDEAEKPAPKKRGGKTEE